MAPPIVRPQDTDLPEWTDANVNPVAAGPGEGRLPTPKSPGTAGPVPQQYVGPSVVVPHACSHTALTPENVTATWNGALCPSGTSADTRSDLANSAYSPGESILRSEKVAIPSTARTRFVPDRMG